MERIVCFDEISHGRRKQRWVPSQTEPGWQGSSYGGTMGGSICFHRLGMI